MTPAEREGHDKAGTGRVRIVLRAYLPGMQFHKRACEIQTYTGTALIYSLSGGRLVETLEDVFKFPGRDSYTIVYYGDAGIFAVRGLLQKYCHLTICRRELECVGEQVHKHLVKI